MTSAATIVELVGRPLRGAHQRDAALHRVERGECSRGATPKCSTRSSRRPSGSSSAMPGIADEIDAGRVEVRLPAEVGRAPGPVAERVEVPARRGAVQRALLGFEILGLDERFRRGGPSSVCASRASPWTRFETAKRMSADLLALRLPPACSRARRRRHMSSARFSIAVVTRGASASPFTRRTVPVTCDNSGRNAARDASGRDGPGQYTRPDAHRDRW